MQTNGTQEAETVGRIVVDINLANNKDVQNAESGAIPAEKIRRLTLKGVVDTGANYLVLPAAAAAQLGLSTVSKATVRYADGRTADRDIVGQVELELAGRMSTFRALLEPDRTTALIGAIVLEDLDLLVDCTSQQLYPRDPDRIIAEVE